VFGPYVFCSERVRTSALKSRNRRNCSFMKQVPPIYSFVCRHACDGMLWESISSSATFEPEARAISRENIWSKHGKSELHFENHIAIRWHRPHFLVNQHLQGIHRLTKIRHRSSHMVTVELRALCTVCHRCTLFLSIL